MRLPSALLPIAFAAAMPMLQGCGTYVPGIAEPWEIVDKPSYVDNTGLLEANIKDTVYCELRRAVMHATDNRPLERVHYQVGGKDIPVLPDTWGVQGTINLEVDETGALNPLGSPIFPKPNMQSITLNLGATLSSQANRVDKYGFYYDVIPLRTPIPRPEQDFCFYDQETGAARRYHADGSSFLLKSDLGIDQWLQNALAVEYREKSSPIKANYDTSLKQDYLSYEVKFIVITSGNASPVWKLIRVSTNTGNTPFISENRTRTHDLLLTFGPSLKAGARTRAEAARASGPSQEVRDAHLASEIGLAVTNGLRSLVTP